VIFRQSRTGWNGKEFFISKFRSMKIHQEQSGKVKQATRDDDRITRVGRFIRKTSIDELPQLFNVLSGKMSMVGPRPHAIEHNSDYDQRIRAYMTRHRIKPGITGLAQVNGYRGETDTLDKMKKRVEFDMQYINNWSLWLDLKILLKTIPALLRDEVY
jgi:putative colanic acid biosynthesis UDP-glucose lipid carrier transferase